jgi:SHS2 domain-containing protein
MSKKTLLSLNGTSQAAAFEEIEHTADRALRIYGANLQELLLNAAHGMNSLMVGGYDSLSVSEVKSVALDAIDAESVLVEWLSELAFWAETEMLVFQRFDLHQVSPTHVKATIYGGRVEKLEKHIKAVTYHNLEITQTDKGLTVTVVFDV